MKRICFSVLVAALAAVVSIRASENGSFYLKNGDRVVFYGDSITDQRLYTTLTETYVVTRFPRMHVSFVHSGWGGDRVTGGGGGPIDERLKRDVFAYKPTVITIMLGMNDGSYRAFDERIFATYTNGYQHIIDSLKEHLPNLRITLIEPSPFDDVTRSPNFPGGYNAVMARYSEYVKELADREHATVADFNAPMVQMLQKANEKDHALAQKIIPDRVHPGPGGHLIMAEQLLKAWNAPAVVSVVEIDAGSKSAKNTEHATVKNISTQNGLSWTETEDSLPMPVDLSDQVVALAVNSSDFLQALDQETLKVSGLEGKEYTLKIDGEDVGSFPKEKLEDGINLAALNTPMMKQAREVHHLTVQHNDIHFARWRHVQVHVKTELPHFKQAMKGLDALEGDVIKQQHEAAQPKSHTFELTVAAGK